MTQRWSLASKGFLALGILVAAASCQSSKTSTTQAGSASSSTMSSDLPPGSVPSVAGFLNKLELKPQLQPLGPSRQLIFNGRRSGEGYFSADGKSMIYQSETESPNPFYQIYMMDLDSGKSWRVSPGNGKTSCGWIHPKENKVLYSSTHGDPKSLAKQDEELKFRASGQKRRYSWDFDPEFEIYESNPKGKAIKNLTKTLGYDAEGSYSPDGKWIVFASNRLAYAPDASEELKSKAKADPSFYMDIYIMKANGSDARRLTLEDGYDGGPFFSPNGTKIIWRKFDPITHAADIYSMNVDGSEKMRLTDLGKISWAPFYHPNGDYFIFASNTPDQGNFELFIKRSDGMGPSVRVTDRKGFDGLPVFTPNGRTLSWAQQLSTGESQIVTATWDDNLARQLLSLPVAAPSLAALSPEITAQDAKSWIDYLAQGAFQGRMTGSPEESLYSAEISESFRKMNLQPPEQSTYIQEFKFTKGQTMGQENRLSLEGFGKAGEVTIASQWTPLSFSGNGEFQSNDLVFVGYGIRAPSQGAISAYDSYGKIDLKGKWALILRDIPQGISADHRLYLMRFSKLEFKARLARQLGAEGVVFVNGPASSFTEELPGTHWDRGSRDAGLPAMAVTYKTLKPLLEKANVDLSSLQASLDKGNEVSPLPVPGITLSGKIDLKAVESSGKNILALLKVPGAKTTLVIGAHGDHLGVGKSESSLMSNQDKSAIHFGADDNASGVAGVLEIAHWLSQPAQRRQLKSNVLFAVWSGEELGNLGSSAFLESLGAKKQKNISAYLNMDMIGRLTESLVIQGVGSSLQWPLALERELPKFQGAVTLQKDPYLPTDSLSFYLAEKPVLSFFTGAHQDYHTPRDTPEKINFAGVEKTAKLVGNLALLLGSRSLDVKFEKFGEPMTLPSSQSRQFRIFLGTIPDYTAKTEGLKVAGVVQGGPAEQAGIKKGDIILGLQEFSIKDIQDYMLALNSLKPDERTKVKISRDGEVLNLEIVPKIRE